MHVTLIAVEMCTKLMYYFSCYHPCNLKSICNILLILLQNKALGIWNSLTLCWVFTNRVTFVLYTTLSKVCVMQRLEALVYVCDEAHIY